MKGLFEIDGAVYKYMMKIYSLIVLNIMFILCAIPIVTIGSSITALYDVSQKMIDHRDTKIARNFFDSFRKNFKQGTKIWLGFIGLWGVLFFIASASGGANVIMLPLILIAVLSIFTLIYAFGIISKFDNTTGNTIRNAFVLSITNIPYSIIMLTFAGVLIVFVPIYLTKLSILSIFLTFSVVGYVQSMIMSKVFKGILAEGDDDEES
ncbi:MAG: YesL family protein [Clostridiales Family XIII bacterium]|jgi:uncharacterized membrane protein YesL|nr:YesL family protein [Clostridiales Family XIII bacterium]